MRWIQFRSNGRFHLISSAFDIIPSVPGKNKKSYETVCEISVIADPDKAAARDKIYKRGIEEYCPKCLEKYEGS